MKKRKSAKVRRRLLLTLACGMIACGSVPLMAQSQDQPPPPPAGALSRAALGDALEKQEISLFGWAEATMVVSDNDGDSVSPGTFFNEDKGVNLNQVGLTLCSGRACPPFSFGPASALHSRVGPFPGPKAERASIDFNLTVLYGEDVQYLRTLGLDGDFGFDRGDERTFAVPQAYAEIYLPLLDGTSVILGSFQSPIANEIGYSYLPPNWFASHTYAFQHGPAKHVGLLAQSRLPIAPEHGFLSVDYGVVLGWNNWDNPNGGVDGMGAVRWRSPDLRTWIDIEAIYGNGENEFGPGPGRGGSPYFALSSTGEHLGRLATYLVATHAVSPRLSLALEATYGRHEGGDIKFVPFALTEDAEWYGANMSARYGLGPKLWLNGRAEWFRDEKGANALWSGVGGDVYVLTGNLEWQPTTAIRVRTEMRYDRHRGPGALFDDFTEEDQLVGLFNLFSLF